MAMGEIEVVAAERGVCVACGNGLWGGPPCEHKRKRGAEREAARRASSGSTEPPNPA